MPLTDYLRRFRKLRVATSRQHGEAPYKPALLLAVLEGIADGSIPDNRIEITPELIAAFKAICAGLSASPLFTAANFALPFYHLRSEGFWHLHPADELDLTVRSGLFKRVVLEAYDRTCAVSGLKLLSTHSSPVPLLDAYHTVPWALCHDDTISNRRSAKLTVWSCAPTCTMPSTATCSGLTTPTACAWPLASASSAAPTTASAASRGRNGGYPSGRSGGRGRRSWRGRRAKQVRSQSADKRCLAPLFTPCEIIDASWLPARCWLPCSPCPAASPGPKKTALPPKRLGQASG